MRPLLVIHAAEEDVSAPPGDEVRQVPLPAVALPGDLAVMAAMYGRLEAFPGAHEFLRTANFPGEGHPWGTACWVSLTEDHLAGDSPSIPVTFWTDGFYFLLQGWSLVIYRNVVEVSNARGVGFSDDPVEYPAYMPPGGDFAPASIGVVMSRSRGTLGGFPEDDETGAWASDATNPTSRAGSLTAHWTRPPSAGDTPVAMDPGEFPVRGTSPLWESAAVDLRLTGDLTPPVVRQWPRDSLGLAAASRIYPIPRTRRVVGGHQ